MDFKVLNKYFPNGVVAFDLETTGLSPLMHEIIEVAAVKVQGNEVSTFSSLIKPNEPIPPFTTEIHGITDDMVKDSPSAKIVIKEFIDFFSGCSLIAHNAKFDIGFIVNHMHHEKVEVFDSEVHCSCKLARAFVPSKNHKLATLCETLEIPLINHHRALDDSWAALKIYAHALTKIQNDREFRQGRLLNLEDFKKNDNMLLPEKIEGLRPFVEKQETVEIKYNGGSMKGKYREIRPIGFLPLPEGNILYAHCLISDMYKSFHVKKIVDFREVEK